MTSLVRSKEPNEAWRPEFKLQIISDLRYDELFQTAVAHDTYCTYILTMFDFLRQSRIQVRITILNPYAFVSSPDCHRDRGEMGVGPCDCLLMFSMRKGALCFFEGFRKGEASTTNLFFRPYITGIRLLRVTFPSSISSLLLLSSSSHLFLHLSFLGSQALLF